MISHQSGYILLHGNPNEHRRLFYNHFSPENQSVKAAVLILHGMKEHSGRYEEFARFLAGNGFAVLTYDHLGHGKSARDSADLGFFQRNHPAGQLVKDAGQIADHLRELHPDVPKFILGHSMGSFITRLLLQESPEKFNGAIIVGTGGKNIPAILTKPFIGLLNRISPRKRNKLVNKMFDKMNNVRFRNEPDATSSSWLSLDKANRLAFDSDPLCGIPFTNNGFHTLISVNTKATRRNWARNIPRQFPLLFVSGEDDPIGNFGNGVRRITAELKKDGFEDVEQKLYKQMRHEILNEKIRPQVYGDIAGWICERLMKIE